MLKITAALAAFAMMTAPAYAAPCRDSHGKFVKCPDKPKKLVRCKDAKGKFAKVRNTRRAPGSRVICRAAVG